MKKHSVTLGSVASLFACSMLVTACTGDDTPNPPACVDNIPTGEIFADQTAAVDHDLYNGYWHVLAASDGRIIVPGYTAGGELSAHIWNGTQWTDAPNSGTDIVGSYGTPLIAVVGDRLLQAYNFSTTSDPTVRARVFMETTPGVWGMEQLNGIAGNFATPLTASAPATLSTQHRVGIPYNSYSNSQTIYFAEHSDTIDWNYASAASVPTGAAVYAVGSGYLDSGQAYILAVNRANAATTHSITLLKRSGAAWNVAKTLAEGIPQSYNFRVYATPEGTSNPRLYLAWEEIVGSTATIKGVIYDFTTDTITPVTLQPPTTITVSNLIYVSFAFSADGQKGLFAIHDGAAGTVRLGSIRSDGALTDSVAYHPELVFQLEPTILFSKCGNPYIADRRYEVGAAATSKSRITGLEATDYPAAM